MKNIQAILEGYDLTDEQRSEIAAAVDENYRSIEEIEKRRARIVELEEQNAALTEQIGSLQGDSEEVENLRKQVADFEKQETERKQRDEEAQKRDSFRALFDAAVGDREFANDLIRDTVFEKAYAQCQSESGTGAKEAIDAVTKDIHGVWKNPQNDVHKMPEQSDIAGKKPSVDDSSKNLLRQLFGEK